MSDERKNCPMRHENGNCMSVGGFCLAVNDGICEGLRNAYKTGILNRQTNNSNWHTGKPTEEGWYLCASGDNFYCANYWQGGTWKNHWGGTLLAYQKIEPYEASKERE